MGDISDRLVEERKRLKMNQTAFGLMGGVQKQAQFNYEKGNRSPDADYLAAIAGSGVDVLYVLTGKRTDTPIRIDRNLLIEVVEEVELAAAEQRLSARKKAELIAMVYEEFAADAAEQRPLDRGLVPRLVKLAS